MNLADLSSRVSRTVRWHRRPIGITAAVVCLFASLSALAPPQPETTPVLVATRALTAGSLLSEADVRLTDFPVSGVPDSAVTDPARAVGRTLTASVTRGSVITDVSTLQGGDDGARADERLVPFRVPDAATVTLLKVGDRITVVGATVEGAAIDLATDVRVAALPTRGESSSFSGESGALIVVAADPETAARLAAASSQMRMAIVLR